MAGLNAGSYEAATCCRNAVARSIIMLLGECSRYGERLRAHPFQPQDSHDSEREAIRDELSHWRLIPLSDCITARYSDFRRHNPSFGKVDALIAATALVKQLPF